jgi:hypothetical protein
MRIFWEDIGGQFNKLSYIVLVLLLASCGSEEAATPISEQPEQPTALPTAEIISTNIPPTEPANEDVEIETTAATAENGEPADEPDFLSGSWTQGADMLSQRSDASARAEQGTPQCAGPCGSRRRYDRPVARLSRPLAPHGGKLARVFCRGGEADA